MKTFFLSTLILVANFCATAQLNSSSTHSESINDGKNQQLYTSTAVAPSLGGTQSLTNFSYTINNGGEMDYYVYYPDDFDANPEDRPILISIHGAAERAGDPSKVLSEQYAAGSPAYLLDKGKKLPMMVFSPHQQSFIGGVYNQTWNIELLKEFVEHIKNSYSIDENRIYMTGFSNGAQAAWQYAVDYPNDIAALVPVSGRTDLSNQTFNVNLQESTYACKLKNMPIHVWHGNNDKIINYGHSADMVNAINQCDPTPNPLLTFSLISGMDHDGMRPLVYSNIDGQNNIYDWMMGIVKGGGIEESEDNTAPKFVQQPKVGNVTTSEIQATGSLDESGIVFWGIYAQNSTPSVQDVLEGRGANKSGSISANSSTFNLTVNGLTSNTGYKLALVARDNHIPSNTQSSVTNLLFTTKAPSNGGGILQTYQLNLTKLGYQSGLAGWNDLAFNGIDGTRSYNSIQSVTNKNAPFTLIAYSGIEGSTINAVTDNGSSYGSGIYPANVIRHAVYTSSTTAKLVFKNMETNKQYTFSILGSRQGSGSRITKYTLNGVEKYLECIDNKDDVIKYEKISPNNNGDITMEFSKSNAGWGYINAIVIEEYSKTAGDNIPPASPTNLQVDLVGVNSLELQWNNSNETDFAYYQLYRNGELVVNNLTESYYLDKNLSYNSNFSYYVLAVDESGNKSSASVTVTETTGDQPIGSESEVIQINLTHPQVSSNLTDWNDISFNTSLFQSNVFNLKNVNNELTEKTLTVWNGTNGSTINDFSNNGSQLNGGVYPNIVLQYAAYTTGQGVCKLNGLNPNFVYDIEIHSGRSGSGSRETAFNVNGELQMIESINNKSNTLLFENTKPNNNGEITISFAKSNSSWGYFNALVISEKSSAHNTRKADVYENVITEELIVYPNPSLGTFTIQSNDNWDENSTLLITDLNGVVLISENISLKNNYQLDSQLTMGVYILRITNNSESFVRQIIVNE